MSGSTLHLASREIDCPNGDVIFIHGLGGDSINTWTSESSVGKGDKEKEFDSFFPSVLAADFDRTNVWSLDYSSHMSNWLDNPKNNELERVCSEIVSQLLGSGIGERPTIFVCHSLGGIVAKEVLRKSEKATYPRLQKLYKNTIAVSFVATPHKGSKWADILNAVDRVLPFIRPSDRIDELELDNVYLETLSAWYREKANEKSIETQAFYEQKKTKGIEVVPHFSANPDVIGCDPIPVNENHINIAKPSKKNSPVYSGLSGLIKYHLYDHEKADENSTTIPIPPQTVVIGVVRDGGKVLMVRRRNPTDNLTWQFVAGRLRAGQETEEECILREIFEETSTHAKIIKRLGEAEEGDIPYKRVYFYLEYLDGEIENKDSQENSDVRWIRVGNVRDFITTPLSPLISEYLDL